MSLLKSVPVAYALSLALTALIFCIDLITPLGTAEWLGYILPLLVAALVLRRGYALALTMTCSFLIFLAFFLDLPLSDAKGSLFNRCLGIMVIWGTTILLLQRKRADDEIRNLNAVLALRADELAAANQELEGCNVTLSERVRQEVLHNREKDYLLILKSRQAAMGEMISNIAHQWRQPLLALELFVQDMKVCHENGQLTNEYVEAHAAKSLSAITQMSQTIDDFMNFFNPNKAKTTFNPKDAITKALSFIEWGARRPAITFNVDAVDEILITGYANEYSQVFLNIFANARDVLAERRIAAPQVDICIFREGNRSVVTVEDNAGGIYEDVIDKVFAPYFTTKEEGKGTGIGLYMSKMIVEMNMKGLLTARNTKKGAEFRVEI